MTWQTASFLLAPILWLTGCALFVALFVMASNKVKTRVWINLGLLVLIGLLAPTSLLVDTDKAVPLRMSEGVQNTATLILYFLPPVGLAVAALLLYSGLHLHQELRKDSPLAGRDLLLLRKQTKRKATISLALSALLLAKIFYNLHGLMLWDRTTDSLDFIWLIIPILVTILSGVILVFALSGKSRLVGLAYALLIIGFMYAIYTPIQRVDFRQETLARATRVSQAVEAYHARVGRYPQDLRQLFPWYMLSIPGPLIINGQGWCYQGGSDFYLLGYVSRPHWSAPILTGEIYKKTGDSPELRPVCSQELAALKARFPGWYTIQ